MINKFKSLVQYVSDIHLERSYKRVIKPQKPFLLLGGDIGYPQEKRYKEFLHDMSNNFDKVFVISGNHEYDLVKPEENEKVDDLIKDICQTRNNLIYFQKKIECLSVEDNLYIAGCTFWSTLPQSKYHLHVDHLNWLKKVLNDNSENKYIIASHHCPLFQCLHYSYLNKCPNYFATNQTDIIRKDNVIAWVHGHSHRNRDFIFEDKHIISNQYGYQQTPLYRYKHNF